MYPKIGGFMMFLGVSLIVGGLLGCAGLIISGHWDDKEAFIPRTLALTALWMIACTWGFYLGGGFK